MSWKLLGGDGRLGIYAWVPDNDGPPPVNRDPAPPSDPFFTGEASVECEYSLAFPCRVADKQPAKYMLAWQLCNCVEPDEPGAICDHCLLALLAGLDIDPASSSCGACGLVFRPARSIIRDLVELP